MKRGIAAETGGVAAIELLIAIASIAILILIITSFLLR